MFRSLVSRRYMSSIGTRATMPGLGPQITARHPGLRFSQSSLRNYATYKRFNNSSSKPQTNYFSFLTNRRTLYFMGGCAVFYVYNLNEAPVTHRYRFIWIPYWLETKIGDYSYRQMVYQFNDQIVPQSNPLYQRIGGIMNKLLTVAIEHSDNEQQRQHLKSLHWSINIIQVDDDKFPPNAFILPNGKIFIFSSILNICQNDDGLATVLSHELSHQLAHHSSEQLSKQPFYIMLSTFLYYLTGISRINDLLIRGLLEMPASREMESEADRIGIELMARSCFNINEAVKFWQRMHTAEQKFNAMGESSFFQFFSTHPPTEKRIHDIHQWLPELERIKEANGCYEYQFGKFSDLSRNFFTR